MKSASKNIFNGLMLQELLARITQQKSGIKRLELIVVHAHKGLITKSSMSKTR
jgi:hypothetical protein